MRDIPRPEYPRPDFQRDRWSNLNGIWDFAFDDNDRGISEKWYREGLPAGDSIVVPYVFQCRKSGIDNQDYHPVIWYSRTFSCETWMDRDRTFLCFGAVDYASEIWINGSHVGQHQGGYDPFSYDITDLLVFSGENKITVRVVDDLDCSKARGKQYWKDHGDRCWYTPSSGIWQTVWLESRPLLHLRNFTLIPDIDTSTVRCQLELSQIPAIPATCCLDVFFKDAKIQMVSFSLDEKTSGFTFPILEEDYIDEIHYWTPDCPNLYTVEFTLNAENSCDVVHSYFGMRKIAIQDTRILLNNRPLYQRMVLDQAYWPESLLTAPSDEALQADIRLIKQMGFNGVRLHQKVEDPRFYYHADTLGLLVWGEMPSFYRFSEFAISQYLQEWSAFIRRDMNHPSIVCWVPLNESWGVRNIFNNPRQQQFAISLYHWTKTLDPSRLVDTNDGWEQVVSDICGVHDYVRDGEKFLEKWKNHDLMIHGTVQERMPYANGFVHGKEPILVTEFGGIAFEEALDDRNWGYADGVSDTGQFLERFEGLVHMLLADRQIQGFCYTQLTDVMQEVNGLLYADRTPKCDISEINRIVTATSVQ